MHSTGILLTASTPRSPRAWLAGIVAFVLFLSSWHVRLQAQPVSSEGSVLPGAKWLLALDEIVGLIRSQHPDPFSRIGKGEFLYQADRVRQELPRQDDFHAVARLMQLVARLNDGHTQLEPAEEPEFARWFPVRFYAFPSGLYVTAIDRAHSAAAGLRVIRIGRLDASEALRVAQSVMGADNPWGQKENLFALSNASLLSGLDVISDPQTLPLELESGDRTNRIELKAVRTDDGSFDGRFRGEMFPPFRRGDVDWVTALGLRAPMDYRKMDETLPLHLRYRFYFFMETLPKQDALYAQINFMQEDDEHRFGDFSRRFFEALDRQPVSRTVLDLRYNSGGNGALAPAFVQEFLRRSDRRPWGQLCLLTGRKTFSAALLLSGRLLEAIPDTVLLGEPSGAGLNHFGDPMSFPIKGTGLRLGVSTVWHQGSSSREQRPFMAVNVPVEMDAKDYFAGRDPVLEAALDSKSGRSIETLAQREGGEAALAVLKERMSKFQSFEGWVPCSELRINELGYELIGRKAFEQAAQVLALNIHAFPGSWNAWDSYGEALAGAGHPEEARRAYGHALELNPGDSGARDYLNKFNSK